ncbi:MAG: DUF4347 domain-containing protein, partial [Microcoleaceae cyanobacterium]
MLNKMQTSTTYSSQMINYRNFANSNINPDQLQPKLAQLVFIDSQVEDYDFLVKNVLPAVAVFVINNANNGIIQISEILKDYQQKYDTSSIAINIIAHGSPGALKIGNQIFNISDLEQYREYLETWNTQSISLYSCALGSGDIGLRFIEKLAEITGAEILASDQPVGHADLGGSWQLQVKREGISNIVPFNPQVLKFYKNILPVLRWESVDSPDDGDPNTYRWVTGLLNNSFTIDGITLGMDIETQKDVNGNSVLANNFPRTDNRDFAGGYSTIPVSLRIEIDSNNTGSSIKAGVTLKVTFQQV